MNRTAKTNASVAQARKEFQRKLDRLAADIQQFRVDYQRFFAGDRPLPPYELRDRLNSDLRRLQTQRGRGAAGRFRLGTLESQFHSFCDLFGRRERERESTARVKPVAKTPQFDPESGVVIGQKPAAGTVEALYKGLYLSQETRNPKMDVERFRSYIDRQAQVIRQKTGCADINFRVVVEDGKTKLKAKPVRQTAAQRG